MHPILFHIGKITVYSYGFMMVMAFLAVSIFNYFFSKRIGFDPIDGIDLTIYTFVSGIIGARLVYVVVNISHYWGRWYEILEFQKGGLSWHGGIFGAAFGIIYFAKRRGYKPADALDLMFTSSIMGLAIGRIGCFLNGCCYGKSCSLPWAVTFPYHLRPHPVHPTQIYELILDLIIFAYLVKRWDHRKFPLENTFLMLFWYSWARFFVEFFRYNVPQQIFWHLSLAQWVSLLIILISGGFLWWKRKSLNKE